MAAAKSKPSPAAERWGYEFGCRGVLSAEEARVMLGNVCGRTLRRYRAQGFIRVGNRIPGKPNSGKVVCRRSLMEFLAAGEE